MGSVVLWDCVELKHRPLPLAPPSFIKKTIKIVSQYRTICTKTVRGPYDTSICLSNNISSCENEKRTQYDDIHPCYPAGIMAR